MNDSKSLHSRIAKTVRDIPRSGIRDFFDIVSSREDVISLGIGEPDFVTPWHIREAAALALDRGVTSYTSNMGLLSLRRGISGYVEKKTGIIYNPEDEVLVTVGVSEGLDLAVRALVEPGDEVLYHEPSYVSYNPIVTFAYGRPVAIETIPGTRTFFVAAKMTRTGTFGMVMTRPTIIQMTTSARSDSSGPNQMDNSGSASTIKPASGSASMMPSKRTKLIRNRLTFSNSPRPYIA